MPSKSDAWRPPGLRLLLRTRVRAVRNRLAQTAQESPLKLAVAGGFLAFIWVGLYVLFWAVFDQLQRTPLEAAVAIPMVFKFFFAALLVMLAVSNGILAYMSLFAESETVCLLAAPVPARAYVLLRYLETLLFSSWSLVLLGLPLMMAMADITDEPWYYYPLFLGFFICFVPIPGAAGLLAAWAAAQFLTRSLRKTLATLAAVTAALATIWFLERAQVQEDYTAAWLRGFLFRMSFIQSALLPSTWVSNGVEAAMQDHTLDALAYLAVTLANALFLSLVAVRIVSRRFLTAFDRAVSSRGSDPRKATSPAGGVAGAMFLYLPLRLRLVAAKDLRTFLRDPLQWTQLAILFGLLGLYLANLPRFSGERPLEGWGMIVPYLNFGAVSFLLATFTSRFVFPLVSLESQQLWLIGMLPISRGRLLTAKFAFAMTVSATVAVSTTALAAVVLRMPLGWALVHIGVTFAVCVGLCGMAVGFGARLPEFAQRSAARVANGFGGTVNLVASVMLVLLMFLGLGWIGVRNRYEGFNAPVSLESLAIAAGVSLFGMLAGGAAMLLGARHLRRIEV